MIVNSDSDISIHALWWKKRGLVVDGRPILLFAGSFMTVFDFRPLLEALNRLEPLNLDFQVVICGDGEKRQAILDMFDSFENVILPGWVNFEQLHYIASNASLSFLPYKNIQNYTLNVPNKAVDALRYGLPIITPLTGKLEELIATYSIGWTYNDHDNDSLANLLVYLFSNMDQVSRFSSNSKSLYSSSYSFDTVYQSLADTIESSC